MVKKKLSKSRRNKLEIFYDILTNIEKERSKGEIKPTRIQQQCNMSYDKFVKNLNELKAKKILSNDSSFQITEKGTQFLQNYSKIVNFLTNLKHNYLEGGNN